MLRPIALCLVLFFAVPAVAQNTATIALQILPLEPFSPGRPLHAIAKLTHVVDGSPVLASELSLTHTKQFHLLIIDEALEDFQHVHPDMREIEHTDCPKWYSCNPGEYPFTWAPKYNHMYRAWADIMPVDTGRQEYAMADMPSGHGAESDAASHELFDIVKMEKYRFTLSFSTPLKADKLAIGHLSIARNNGKPVCTAYTDCRILEPVLGAFAHIVGFNEDFNTVLHAHPIGAEPSEENNRSLPELDFHIGPEKPGFYKLFIQLRIDGKTLFVPFGIDVNPN